ncbi:IS5 family transposase [Escherichia coli]|uniref:IS5 family transposase n=9 Tax=Gammaproteobacteria TaxID=1236 RepID=UPI0024B3D6FF|nr:IS5 family transposase [Escherichia coli]WHD22676.1 IS5 family transposase [Escherichia coli]
MKDQITYLPDNADRSVAKQKFKITNWPTYNKALINRGSITFWLDDEAIQAWYESATPSSRGRPQRYSDLAITTVLVIKRVFRLTLRAAQGFIDSIFSLMNVPLRCPDYSCVSRRAKSVNISFKTPTRGEIAHLVIDSTGLKVFGKTLFNELSVILPQSKNSQTSSLWDAFAYTLAILYYENFKNAYRSEQGYIKKDVLIKDILFYLNNNYREKITLEQLSKKFRASVSYICHEFTKEYRISPINYVIQRRMTEAKWSLTNTELSQAEISWRVGYENVDHFAKLFLRHVGCSPSDYRRQFKNCFAEQEILSEFPQPVSLAG